MKVEYETRISIENLSFYNFSLSKMKLTMNSRRLKTQQVW